MCDCIGCRNLVWSSINNILKYHIKAFIEHWISVMDNVEDTLSYMEFPTEHWHKIRTNNGLERIMKKIRRRTKVVGSFPDGYSAIMLVGARLRHISTTKWGTCQYRLQNIRNGCIIRKWHNFYNQSKRNVRKIPDTTYIILTYKIRCCNHG